MGVLKACCTAALTVVLALLAYTYARHWSSTGLMLFSYLCGVVAVYCQANAMVRFFGVRVSPLAGYFFMAGFMLDTAVALCAALAEQVEVWCYLGLHTTQCLMFILLFHCQRVLPSRGLKVVSGIGLLLALGSCLALVFSAMLPQAELLVLLLCLRGMACLMAVQAISQGLEEDSLGWA